MLKVTYAVEATRVEQRTDFDRLVVDVETKPSIEPRDAIASAGSTLVELFGLLRELNIDAEGIEVGPSPAEAADIANFSMPIEDMDLTVRSYNCLKREGVHTVGELVTRSEADLLDIRNFGAKSIDEVKLKLAAMGLALKDSPPGFVPTSVESYDETYDDSYPGEASTPTARSTPRATSARPSSSDRRNPPPHRAAGSAGSGTCRDRSSTVSDTRGRQHPGGLRKDLPCPPPPRAPASAVRRRTSG